MPGDINREDITIEAGFVTGRGNQVTDYDRQEKKMSTVVEGIPCWVGGSTQITHQMPNGDWVKIGVSVKFPLGKPISEETRKLVQDALQDIFKIVNAEALNQNKIWRKAYNAAQRIPVQTQPRPSEITPVSELFNVGVNDD